MKVVLSLYACRWVNVALLEGMQTTATSICEYLSNFDHYWVKSNWEWIVDRCVEGSTMSYLI